ncbi:MAG: MltA domain-containing protein [Pseudomonadota bacterium]
MKQAENTKISKIIILPLLLVLSLSACQRALKVKETENALVLLKRCETPIFTDDINKDSLKTAIERSIEYLKRLPSDREFVYGPHTYNAGYLIESMNLFLDIFENSVSPKDLHKKIKKLFYIYKSVGSDGKGSVLFTGYYEPVLKGSLTMSDEYRYPLYTKPGDLMVIDLGQFHPKFKSEKIVARYDGNTVIPYYSRREIDLEKVLEGKGLELFWVSDPVDLFFLHVQGSGIIDLGDAKTQRIHYAESNGKPYRSIGKKLIDENVIPREEISLQSIKTYLKDHPEERDSILCYNESYVFFEKVNIGPIGNLEVVLTPGRSIATDYRLFPKGGLAFITTQKPKIDPTDRITGWKSFSRFAVNQDTGGAIRGPGRVDLFWGSEKFAEIAAGAMQQYGEIYFLVKKPSKN